MENNNTNPEEKEEILNTGEDSGKVEAETKTNVPEQAGETAPAEANENAPEGEQTPEAAETTELQTTLVGDSLTVIPVAPVKKKTGLIVGIAAAIIAVCLVIGFVVVGQTPENVVKKALVKTYAAMNKQSTQMIADIPVLAKQEEIAKGGSITDMTLRLNSMEAPGMDALLGTVISGTTISGTTKADPVNNIYSNSYGISMLGQRLATLDLFTSPTVLSVGVPEFFANSYYLDMDKMTETGAYSYLFGHMLFMSQENLQTFADMYKGYMTSLGSMNPEALKAMEKRMGEICMENLQDVEYAKVTVDGKKQYTVAIPAQSINDILSATLQYIYLESPLSGQMLAMMAGEAKTEFINSINTLSDDIAKELPQTPTIVTMEIEGGMIKVADILTEGSSTSGVPMRFNLRMDGNSGTMENVTCNLVAGEGEMGVVMDMKATSTYSNKIMDVAVEMEMATGGGTPVLSMGIGYKLDGGLTSNNIDFAMDYAINTPMMGDSMEVKLALAGKGDYGLQGDKILMKMSDVNYDIISTMGAQSIPINMNFGIDMTQSALGESLAMPQGTDMLTLTEADTVAIAVEFQAGLEKLLGLFMGKLI